MKRNGVELYRNWNYGLFQKDGRYIIGSINMDVAKMDY